MLVNGKITPQKAKSRTDVLNALLRAHADSPTSGSSGGFGPGIETINVISIPTGWQVVSLFGAEAHMPTETYFRLKKLLPDDAFAPLIPGYLPPPIDDVPPVLKVFEGGREPDPPPAA